MTGHSTRPGTTAFRRLNNVRKTLSLITVVATAALLTVSLVGCDMLPGRGGDTTTGEQTDANAEQPLGGQKLDTVFAVNVTPAVQGPISNYLDINGDVETTASIDVYSNAAGEVARLHTELGRFVREGQLIAEIDASRPGQVFALSPVTAPIAGTVTRLPIRVGSKITQSTPVAQISRTNELEIVVNVAERFVSRVKEGLTAVVRLDAFPDRDFTAVVRELNPVLDPMSRTLEVTLRFTGNIEGVRPGMYAEVRIITEKKENIVKVPADVLIRRFGENFVFVVTDDGTAERRIVKPGIEIDNIMEITQGLSPGELVVYQGQNLLEDGTRVRVIDTVEPLAIEQERP